MTAPIWSARLGKRAYPDDPGWRILCGWHVGPDYCTAPPIAWYAGADTPGGELAVIVPVGLTDALTPRVFRWSRKRRQTIARTGEPDIAPSLRVERLLPLVLPCVRGHRSRIDAGVLGA